MTPAVGAAAAAGLSLTRRPGQRVAIRHLELDLDLEVRAVGQRAIVLAVHHANGCVVVYQRSLLEPEAIAFEHRGERLEIDLVAVNGRSVRLRFRGPISFQIQRDDIKKGHGGPSTAIAV
jgi:hypothetical protein